MSNIKKRSEGGFTIIEVLIVLAIAGLIMLIVFLAVPALQRNSRNTQRKNDISSLLSAVNEYTNNNAGGLPTQFSDFSGNVKLGYYSNVTFSQSGTTTSNTNVDSVIMESGYKCTTTNGKQVATTTGATTRSIVALYAVEAGGGATVQQCQES